MQPDPETPEKILSPRELQVLERKADGKSYADIGADLGIKPRTALYHAIHAKEKLKAENMVEAVAIAVRLKLIYIAEVPAEPMEPAAV